MHNSIKDSFPPIPFSERRAQVEYVLESQTKINQGRTWQKAISPEPKVTILGQQILTNQKFKNSLQNRPFHSVKSTNQPLPIPNLLGNQKIHKLSEIEEAIEELRIPEEKIMVGLEKHMTYRAELYAKYPNDEFLKKFNELAQHLKNVYDQTQHKTQLEAALNTKDPQERRKKIVEFYNSEKFNEFLDCVVKLVEHESIHTSFYSYKIGNNSMQLFRLPGRTSIKELATGEPKEVETDTIYPSIVFFQNLLRFGMPLTTLNRLTPKNNPIKKQLESALITLDHKAKELQNFSKQNDIFQEFQAHLMIVHSSPQEAFDPKVRNSKFRENFQHDHLKKAENLLYNQLKNLETLDKEIVKLRSRNSDQTLIASKEAAVDHIKYNLSQCLDYLDGSGRESALTGLKSSKKIRNLAQEARLIIYSKEQQELSAILNSYSPNRKEELHSLLHTFSYHPSLLQMTEHNTRLKTLLIQARTLYFHSLNLNEFLNPLIQDTVLKSSISEKEVIKKMNQLLDSILSKHQTWQKKFSYTSQAPNQELIKQFYSLSELFKSDPFFIKIVKNNSEIRNKMNEISHLISSSST